MNATFDTDVRLELYRSFVRTAEAPAGHQIAQNLGADLTDVRAALERLASGKAIVLQPESREILMANPLCAVPSPYCVRAGGRFYFGSCAWDAMGIMAMLGGDSVLDASCGCCGESMSLAAHNGRLEACPGIVHFAIPAKRWWENIVFT